MRVFVTGAAGFIGRALVKELLSNGHQVLALVRSDASAKAVQDAGAQPFHGNLEDLDSLTRGAQAADGVIHLGYIHDFSDIARAQAVDRAAVAALAKPLAGTGKPVVIVTGTLLLQKGIVANEKSPLDLSSPLGHRALAEQLIQDLSKDESIRGSVVRLSPTVHGQNDWAFMPLFIQAARKNGYATIVGDGSQRWPAIHREDAAVLLRLALEKGSAGAIYHAVAETGVPAKDYMGIIAGKLGVPVKSLTVEEAKGIVGFLAGPLDSDNPVSSEWTQRELGWKPTQIGLLEDLDKNYFN